MSGEEWIERAEAALAGSGHKRGGARSALLALLAAQTCVLSVADIERAQTDPRRRSISRASIYRILDELEQLHLVQRVEVGQGNVRYERARPTAEHHHHLVCVSCRSEEHTSELQSQSNLVCRLLLEKKKTQHTAQATTSLD